MTSVKSLFSCSGEITEELSWIDGLSSDVAGDFPEARHRLRKGFSSLVEKVAHLSCVQPHSVYSET